MRKMRFNNPYWSVKTKMSVLQRWLIVHSILYYELNDSVVSDKVFDANAHQLVDMQNKYTDIAEETEYWYVFYDFDASTGFHLYDRIKEKDKKYLTHIAQHVLALNRGGLHETSKSSNRE